jgi:hypothetical protein
MSKTKNKMEVGMTTIRIKMAQGKTAMMMTIKKRMDKMKKSKKIRNYLPLTFLKDNLPHNSSSLLF